jgi:hypothetical protein
MCEARERKETLVNFLGLKPEEECQIGRSRLRWKGYIEKAVIVWTELF